MKSKYETYRLELARDILALIKGDRSRSLIAAKMIAEGLRKLHDSPESEKGKGKFLGHWPRWSMTVVKDYELDPLVFKHNVKKFRHEHVVPVLIQAKILLRMSRESTLDDVLANMDKYGIVAIITREEDKLLLKSMPKDWDYLDTSVENLWIRYKMAGIFDDMLDH